ncbi:flagellar FlbD family protein [Lutispora saccharofermentans]|uniref:Flagellar FlbD family protein n=1 Tax=Lutispora saccharofermentans TaxID=3024236 RepID=A0ABT1NA98_9FIRM|nr:flagellar FlbD family protein [Lutispora saccharofermentans]MCQ1527994.1 flagellar FlbD family protein [Lutispora saccharofermentans]
MIKVTRLNGKEYYINYDLIETIEETPDTVMTLRDGKKYVVLENAEEIIHRIIDFKRKVFTNENILIKD